MTTLVPSIDLPGLKSKAGRRIARHSVQARVIVYPHSNDPVFPNRKIDPIRFDWTSKTDASLRRLSWSKQMGKPAGQWTATIKEKPLKTFDATRDIQVDDWVDISIQRNGVEIPICRGIIDTITESTTGEGATIREWQLTGRDHGAIWEFPIAYQNIYVRTLNEIVAGLYTKRVKGKIGGNPSEMFNILIEAALSGGKTSSPWVLPDRFAKAQGVDLLAWVSGDDTFKAPTVSGAGSVIDILEIENDTPTRGAFYNETNLWTKPGDGLGQTISNWCNPLLNEFIYDLQIDRNYPSTGKSNAKISATIRERPFVIADSSLELLMTAFPNVRIESMYNSPWFKITTWELPNWLIQNATLGRSNAERFNLFELLADVGFGGSEGEQCAQAPPALYRKSIESHGLRPMLESTRFVADTSKGKGIAKWVEERKTWQSLMVNWHCLNPWLTSGTIVFPIAIPEARIGHRISITHGRKDDNWSYYLEGIGLNWMAAMSGTEPAKANTEMMVSRGWKGTDASLVKAVLKVSKLYETKFK